MYHTTKLTTTVRRQNDNATANAKTTKTAHLPNQTGDDVNTWELFLCSLLLCRRLLLICLLLRLFRSFPFNHLFFLLVYCGFKVVNLRLQLCALLAFFLFFFHFRNFLIFLRHRLFKRFLRFLMFLQSQLLLLRISLRFASPLNRLGSFILGLCFFFPCFLCCIRCFF